MDSRTKAPAKARAGQDAAGAGAVPAGNTGGVGDLPQQDAAAEPAPGPVGPQRPTVFGRAVDHFALLMRQGEQAWLLGGDRGNHEYANIRYMALKGAEPKYFVKDGASRLGGIELLGVDVDTAGAWLTWTEGFRTHIPSDYFQLTWKA